jgi:acyl carrier protein
MDKQTVADTIRQFVADSFLVDFDKVAGPDTDLFEAKYLDSFGFVDLVSFLEKTFTIKLSEDDLADPRIGTLNGMQALVLKRMGERAAAP